MNRIRPKKRYGQHFLKDENIARKIVDSLSQTNLYSKILEVGPGTGVLTKFLVKAKSYETYVIEIDAASVKYLRQHIPELSAKENSNTRKTDRIIPGDFLKIDLSAYFTEPIALIGNFPYNISTQILFTVHKYRNLIVEMVGMFQKEVAERIASPPGNKRYGIPSVLMQAFYNIEYLFTVDENVFFPQPKVKSGVIRLIRNNTKTLDCNEQLFTQVVKTGFNQRRKKLSNALKSIISQPGSVQSPLLSKRAEQLSVSQFVELTNLIERS